MKPYQKEHQSPQGAFVSGQHSIRSNSQELGTFPSGGPHNLGPGYTIGMLGNLKNIFNLTYIMTYKS